MTENKRGLSEVLRENGVAVSATLVLVMIFSLTARWVFAHRDSPGPRKVVTLTGVIVKPPTEPPKPTAPPPPPVVRPKAMDEPQRNRVDLKDLPPLNAPPPPQNAPGGRLSLAAEATGEGDAFNLAGNPGGRGLLSGGGLGDGTGDGIGSGDGRDGRYAWYYGKLASELEDAYRKSKRIKTARARVELRIWADRSGRVSRLELVHSTGDTELDAAIQSVVGLRLRQPPPPDIPMPMIARFTARRASSD